MIHKNVFNVGIDDCRLSKSYNAYLIIGDKNVLIDGVPEEFAEQYAVNIEEIVPIKNIDYFICNHADPEHSESIKKLIKINNNIIVVGTVATIKNLQGITGLDFKNIIAKKNIQVGHDDTLEFLMTPNLPWPDTMMTYYEKERTLFSCDVFSCKHSGTYADFYKNYLRSFDGFMRVALDKISLIGVDAICPGHGNKICNNEVTEVLSEYKELSSEKNKSKKDMIVFYSSIYGYTKEMAMIIGDEAKKTGLNVVLHNAETDDFEKMTEDINSADLLAFGSNTINKKASVGMIRLISEIDVTVMRNTPYMTFGSYGWSGEGTGIISSYLSELKLKKFDKPFLTIFRITDEEKNKLKNYTRHFIENNM